jgi:hypothetical protein
VNLDVVNRRTLGAVDDMLPSDSLSGDNAMRPRRRSRQQTEMSEPLPALRASGYLDNVHPLIAERF